MKMSRADEEKKTTRTGSRVGRSAASLLQPQPVSKGWMELEGGETARDKRMREMGQGRKGEGRGAGQGAESVIDGEGSYGAI